MAKIRELVRFRGDLLFNGAVNIDWFGSDDERTAQACKAFVFHGPDYHGVIQSDVGEEHHHRLVDTATFARSIIRRCAGIEEQPFTLAIAGYGTGKSHFAITMAQLLTDPNGQVTQEILSNLRTADDGCALEITTCLKEMSKPCLVIGLNGMSNFDLAAEATNKVIAQLRHHHVSTQPLDDLRPRFTQAARMLTICDQNIIGELAQSCGKKTLKEVIDALGQQDESVYLEVHRFFANLGMPIIALGGESIKDIIELLVNEYVGENRPFAHLLILFDEFGRYTEFATIRHQIAGSGVLQQLFEGVQASKGYASFVGFIQYDLNSYTQRVAPELKNDILRVITRYQSSDKAYLSVNLETLIASLIEKRRPKQLHNWFDSKSALQNSTNQMNTLIEWFPQIRNHSVWTNSIRFHQVVRKGCWPLSPAATWFLYHLTATGRHLQERSAIALLGDFFQRWNDAKIDDEFSIWSAAPVDLWSEELEHEFLTSEEGGTQGMVTHSYSSVVARYQNQLGHEGVRILRSIVIASKLGLTVVDKNSALAGIALLAGRDKVETKRIVGELQDNLNVLEWDTGFRQFEIIGDAASKVQFLAHIRKLVAGKYDETGIAGLFTRLASSLYEPFAQPLASNFSEEHNIATPEWRFEPMLSNSNLLETHLKLALNRWTQSTGVEQARGMIIYCYVGSSQDPAEVATRTEKTMKNLRHDIGVDNLPIMVLLITDEDNRIGKSLAELAIITEALSAEDESRFRSLVPAYKEKLLQSLRICIEDRIKQQLIVAGTREKPEGKRLAHIADHIFELIYTKPLPFPFDGFATAHGNAAETCSTFIRELVSGTLDHDSISAKPPKEKNRADTVLNRSWHVISKSGSINRLPGQTAAREIVIQWDRLLTGKVAKRLIISESLRYAMGPPYGANIASSSLLFGVFLSARRDNVAVARGSEQIDLTHWLQSDIWRGRYLDLDKLNNDEIVVIGDVSSEWETLLGDWDQADSYADLIEFRQRADELKKRIAVPSALRFQLEHLQEKATEIALRITQVEAEQERWLKKIEKGYQSHDVGAWSWGATELLKILERMTSEKGRWKTEQLVSIDRAIIEVKSEIIKYFKRWLSSQAPSDTRPDTVGEFKQRMRLIGANLEKLSFIDQARQLDERVMSVIRNVENAAEAKQIVIEVSRFIAQNNDAFGLLRLRRLRDLKVQANMYSKKLIGMGHRVDTNEITDARNELITFQERLVEAEKEATKSARNLLKMQPKTEQDLDVAWRKLEEIERTFEGCERDLEDFALMRQSLDAMREAIRPFKEIIMSWKEFGYKAEIALKQIKKQFSDKDSPWDVAELFEQLIQIRRAKIEAESNEWITDIEQEWSKLETASVDVINRLYSRLTSPPVWLSPKAEKRLLVCRDKIEKKLYELEVEWLIERFQQLPETSKINFLNRIGAKR